ncbi:MAG: hypothetical protein IME92_06890 [Proteobacteria bacterium]|nr:hypothetical protein [Pseudomonadota bacterium]
MYFVGKGVEQDYAEAASWYGKVATQGDEGAKTKLEEMYANGQAKAKE